VELRSFIVVITTLPVGTLVASRLGIRDINTARRLLASAPDGVDRMQLEEDVSHPLGTNAVDFQRRQFVAERIGWAAMALFLAWALLGGFGEGWLSRRHAWNEDRTVGIDYDRYGRRDAPMELRLYLQPKGSADELAVHLNREFIDAVEIERITPDYRNMVLDDDGAAATFSAEPGASDYSITIEYKPRQAGRLHGELRALGKTAMTFDQFIYP
jgi:hypothetical protein